MSFCMNTLHKLKQPSARLVASFLLALQATMGVPFLLTIVGSFRHCGAWFNFRNPR
jgi:hypothetical protein